MAATPMPPTNDPVEKISLEDLRHKALKIRTDIEDEVQVQVNERRNQIVLVGVVAVVAVVSIAYLAGTLAGRRAIESQAV